MAGHTARHARIEHDRNAAGLRLAGAEAPDNACSRLGAYLARRREVGIVETGGIIVVALHRGSLARDDAYRTRMTRRYIVAEKAVRSCQDQAAKAAAGTAARRVGDALHGKCCFFRRQCRVLQVRGRHFCIVDEIEIYDAGRKARRIGEALVRVLRRNPCHRHRAFGQRHGIGGSRSRHAGDPLTQENPQRDIVGLGCVGSLDLAKADRDAGRARTDRHGVGRIGTGAAGCLHERGNAIGQCAGIYRCGHGIPVVAVSLYIADITHHLLSRPMMCNGAAAMTSGGARVEEDHMRGANREKTPTSADPTASTAAMRSGSGPERILRA